VSLPARIAFLLLLAVSPACSTATTIHPLNEPVSIVFARSADFAGGLRVAFTSLISDSRCPRGVTCIQAGEAVVALTCSSRNGPSEAVHVSSARSKNQIEVPGFVIELLGVSAHEHGVQDASVTLRVTGR
jgi:hypothetical protein